MMKNNPRTIMCALFSIAGVIALLYSFVFIDISDPIKMERTRILSNFGIAFFTVFVTLTYYYKNK